MEEVFLIRMTSWNAPSVHMKLKARRLNSKYWTRKSTPCETLFPLLLCVVSITLEKPPSRPFSPLIPSSAPPSRASQQPRERHVSLSEQQAPEKINLPRFMVSSAKPPLEAFSVLFLLSLTLLLSLSMHPSFYLHLSLTLLLSVSHSLHRSSALCPQSSPQIW